uniref:Uncharacterized protein n=2 Tax=Octactis speculum TaxID=3111310 RepID=A0A7S2HNL0_9STRA|mmetsp:Transcript_8018/g.10041  ORF Transcript_8018/g.10041 Transcript_8018/m.10041 type:complete len:518 (+) Transcript_8018:73-1626(+)|eukprot:CAMPEP_0185784328 /NCGR_PEP_ID=MMETSP1174-20130828/122500_1 /TAXON_ID=35687 /ORGANISM="Dictyocha speculum, Strain CCMP1381" /LENGTH=517 /DNA_ID=CAMNT_0028475851 /DNA_START=52 /DNA_END=1605 /DNA_ORIENTATION=-
MTSFERRGLSPGMVNAVPEVHLHVPVQKDNFFSRQKKTIALSLIAFVAIFAIIQTSRSVNETLVAKDKEGAVNVYWSGLDSAYEYGAYSFNDDCDTFNDEWTVSDGEFVQSMVAINDDDEDEQCTLTSKDKSDNVMYLTNPDGAALKWDQYNVQFDYVMRCRDGAVYADNNENQIVSSLFGHVKEEKTFIWISTDQQIECKLVYKAADMQFTMSLFVDQELQSKSSIQTSATDPDYEECAPFKWDFTIGENKDVLMCALSQEKDGQDQLIVYTSATHDSKTNGGIGFKTNSKNIIVSELQVSQLTPSSAPTGVPTPKPTGLPTSLPTPQPSTTPTSSPSHSPSTLPTHSPSETPTPAPTEIPMPAPTSTPSSTPSSVPTKVPISAPTSVPSSVPTPGPTSIPTSAPTTWCYQSMHTCAAEFPSYVQGLVEEYLPGLDSDGRNSSSVVTKYSVEKSVLEELVVYTQWWEHWYWPVIIIETVLLLYFLRETTAQKGLRGKYTEIKTQVFEQERSGLAQL